ncbi:hypothetical protein C8T65DRAFT_807425 [Cerioporus squamosus]|nr:hypothetical protein C8T65DRAFT_807425 [Cerioporus squamosus]
MTSTLNATAPSLLRLNSDVLFQILQELRPRRQLRALSESCQYVRLLTMPVLFRKCRVRRGMPITSRFLPTSLWPHVQSLLLVDACPSRHPKESKYRTDNYVYSLRYSDDPLLCGALDAEVLKRSLPAMPRLNSISVSLPCREVHGIRGDVAAALLSAPQVRDVYISLFLFCPRQSIFFKYRKNPFHVPPRAHPSEVEAVRMVVSKVHASLEVLKLPMETMPLDVMFGLCWPQLHHLNLHGDSPPQYPIPLIAVICRMPQSRILTLELTILPNMSRQCIWPPNWTVDDALPQIDELTVAHPHPEDLLYTHLPSSIRRLSLCCAPCCALQLWFPDDYRRWKSPLPSASELLRILSGSTLPHLTHLGVDFNPDGREEELMQHLSDAHPHLSSIELHRVGETPLAWPEGMPTVVSVRSLHLRRCTDPQDHWQSFITRALSQLRRLHNVRLNLNVSYSGGPYDDREYLPWLGARSLETAEKIGPMLGPSVTLLSLLAPTSTGAEWIEYRVSATETSERMVSETTHANTFHF